MRVRFIILSLLLAPLVLFASSDTPAGRVEQTYRTTGALFESQRTNTEAAWQFASACFDQCEFSHNDTDRARIAEEGIEASRQAISLKPNLAPAHYYLAMDLAQLARTKSLGALKLLEEMEKEWNIARELDENFDYAGADRNLGSLYLDAPGWPLSIGSRPKAREHFLRALQLHPEYPENHLNMIEAYWKWNEVAESKLAAKELVKNLPEARKTFAGPAWESNWDDWNTRWSNLQVKLSKWTEHPAAHRK